MIVHRVGGDFFFFFQYSFFFYTYIIMEAKRYLYIFTPYLEIPSRFNKTFAIPIYSIQRLSVTMIFRHFVTSVLCLELTGTPLEWTGLNSRLKRKNSSTTNRSTASLRWFIWTNNTSWWLPLYTLDPRALFAFYALGSRVCHCTFLISSPSCHGQKKWDSKTILYLLHMNSRPTILFQ